MLRRLNKTSLSLVPACVERPRYERQDAGVGIVHIGPGAFFRAHQAVFIDDAMNFAGGDWRICAISLRSAAIRDALREQDNLYTLAVLDEAASLRIVGAIAEIMVAPEKPSAAIVRMADPEVRIVTLTITEKGYCLSAAGDLDFDHSDIVRDLANPNSPKTAIGFLTEALRVRREKNIDSFVAISCDNITCNGRRLKRAVVSFAEALNPGLAEWIEVNSQFPCTMVDAITPATDDRLRESVASGAGVEDRWPVQREPFAQWVMEDFDGPRPAWDAAGVQFTPDVSQFETAKLRLLNAPHSALAYLGSLADFETVRDAMASPELQAFLHSMTTQEILPALSRPMTSVGKVDLHAYRDMIIQRFKNPNIHHCLSQIAWDGSQKLQQRVFPALAENLAATRSIERLTLIIAAWRRFCAERLRKGEALVEPRSDDVLFSRFVHAETPTDVVLHLAGIGDILPPAIASNTIFRTTLKNAEALLGDGSPSAVLSAAAALSEGV